MKKIRRQWLWDKTEGYCAYCYAQFTPDNPMTVDHIISRQRGGSNARSNLLPCCRPCNSSKGPRSVEYLRMLLSRRRAGVPFFNAAQLAYLKRSGIELPAIRPWVFLWEELGNTMPVEPNG